MSDSTGRKRDPGGHNNSEQQRRDSPRQNNPQSTGAPVPALPFDRVIYSYSQFNDPFFPSVNSQLAAQQILLQQLRSISQQQQFLPQSRTASVRYATETQTDQGIGNIPMLTPPQYANTIGSMLGANVLPAEPSLHSQAPSAALGDHTEKSDGDDKSSEDSLSQIKLAKPKRPLSAYNIFFQEERAKIIGEREDGGGKESPATSPTHKKQRYQPNGTGFEDLAKEISKRWKSIDSERLVECSRVAEADTERYQTELAAYNNRREESLSAKQRAQEASVSEETWRQYHAAAAKQKPSRKRKKKDEREDAKPGP